MLNYCQCSTVQVKFAPTEVNVMIQFQTVLGNRHRCIYYVRITTCNGRISRKLRSKTGAKSVQSPHPHLVGEPAPEV